MTYPTGRGQPPMYARLAALIRQDILAGRLRPGDRVPSEPELMADFSVSKTTANEALKVLVAEGLVVRRTGTGSFVAAVVPSLVVIEAPSGSRVSARWPRAGEPLLVVEQPGEPERLYPADSTVILFR